MIELAIPKPKSIKNDFLSGITVALALIPEAIAFSFIAHVDPKVGLYAAFIMGLVTALIGGRPGMISGATGAVAVIFAPLVISQIAKSGVDVAMAHLFLAVCIMGVIQVVFGLLRWGKFVRLIPHSVMLGFVNGLAIIIFKAQLMQFYIIENGVSELLPFLPLMVMIILILITMGISHYLPRITTAIPATLTAIIFVTILGKLIPQFTDINVYTVLDFIQRMDPTKMTVAITLPKFILPVFTIDAFLTVLPYAILAATVGLIESLLTLVLVDELTQTRGRGNKESIGQGIANLINGFFGGMGGCAMIGQSMINIRAGGRGRLSGVVAAIFLLAFAVFGAVFIEAIPLAALVGVMFMVSIGTFEWTSLRLFRQVPMSDFLVIIVVSLTTVFVDLAIAVIVGVIISALVFAWEHGKKIQVTIISDDNSSCRYVLNGGLFFGSATLFKGLFNFETDPNHVYIDFKDARVYDHSGIEAIQYVANRYRQKDKKLHLLNVSKECRDLLYAADNIVEVSIIENLNWYLADDRLA